MSQNILSLPYYIFIQLYTGIAVSAHRRVFGRSQISVRLQMTLFDINPHKNNKMRHLSTFNPLKNICRCRH